MGTTMEGGELYINDDLVPRIANSLTLNDGEGETIITSQIIGGGQVDPTSAEDFSTKIGGFTVDMLTTVENVALKRKWKKNGIKNVGRFTSLSGEVTIFPKLALTNSVDINVGADTVMSLEFKGSPSRTA